MRAAIENWAGERQFRRRSDSYGNIVIEIPASAGCEAAPAIVLQAHLDMVCERLPEVKFDFEREPITVRVEGDWVLASGTTLGADNGIGVAAALAIADDPTAVHGPLEILLTVEEELGLRGALQLDGTIVHGRILLNLDSEDRSFYIGCAGAADNVGVFNLQPRVAVPSGCMGQVIVSGLRGGHSGLEIINNPANALKLLAMVLKALRDTDEDLRIFDLVGGTNRNAVPRDAHATLWVHEDREIAVAERVGAEEAALRNAFGDQESSLRIEWRRRPAQPDDGAWSRDDADRIIDALLACPHGTLALSRSLENLVETSNNLACIRTCRQEVTVSTLARSSSNPSLAMISEQIAAVFRLAGATARVVSAYPGWQPNVDSPLLGRASAVYQRLFGTRPEIRAIHGGLECGVIGGRVGGLDAISFGPTIEGAHTPKERVHIGSVAAFYRLLSGILAEYARPRSSPPLA